MQSGFPGAIFRCAGSYREGLGHLSRAAMLARALELSPALFVVHPDPLALGFLEARGLEAAPLPAGLTPAGESQYLASLAASRGLPLVILDCKDNPAELLDPLRRAGLATLDLEDRGPGRSHADLLIDQHVWPGDSSSRGFAPGTCGFGPDWALLDPQYAKRHQQLSPPLIRERVAEVVIACGGSDPGGLAARVLQALERWCEPLRITLVTGPGAREEALPPSCRHRLERIGPLPGLAEVLSGCDLAFVSGGITMSESLCLGVPTIVVPQHEEQYCNAARFAAREALLLAPPAPDPRLPSALVALAGQALEKPDHRRRMSRNGRALVDGGGVRRLTERLAALAAGATARPEDWNDRWNIPARRQG